MAMTGGKDYLVRSAVTNYGKGNDITKLYIRVKEDSQSITNNQTKLKVGMWVTSKYAIGTWADSNSGSYLGTATSGTNCKKFNGTINYGSGVRWIVENKEFTITHNNDGTKTVRIYWKLNVNSPWGQYVYPNGYIDVKLTTIQRASQPSCISKPNTTQDVGDIGSTIKIYMNRASSSFTHTVKYAWCDKTDTIGTKVANDITWTIPMEFCNDYPNATKGWGRIIVDTYNGTTKIGTKEVKFDAHIPKNDSTKPTVSMSVTLNNSSLSDKFEDLYVQGKSRVDVTLSGDGKYNANIKSYSTVIDDKTYNGQTNLSDVIKTSGSQKITGTVTDSRGYTNSVFENINVIPYSKPWVIPLSAENAIMCYRSDGNGHRISNSTSVWVKAKMNYSTVTSSGTQKNFCALQYRLKATNGSWGEWTDLISKSSIDTDEYNGLISNEIFDLKKAYTIEIRAIDDIGEYDIKTVEIPTQDVALHLGNGGKNVSVGTYCDYSKPYTFQCNWKAHFKEGFEDGTDIGWVELNNVIKYRVKNGFVTVIGQSYYDVTLSASSIVYQLPEKCYPLQKIYFVYSALGNSASEQTALIDTDGQLSLVSNSGEINMWGFTVTYPI